MPRTEFGRLCSKSPVPVLGQQIVEWVLSLSINASVYYDAEPVLQHVGLQDIKRLQKFEVCTCLLNPERAGRPEFPLGSHDLNHELSAHAAALTVLHIGELIEYDDFPVPRVQDDRLLTCLPSLRTLVSLHISLHLLFSTFKGLQDELKLEPRNQKTLNRFLSQRPPTLQNIHFIEKWHHTSFGILEDDEVTEALPATILKLMRYMCKNWLMPNGRPQHRTLELTPHDKRTYAKDVHPALMGTESLQGLLTADVCDNKYT